MALYPAVRRDGGSFKRLRRLFTGNVCRGGEHIIGDNRVRDYGIGDGCGQYL